MSKRIVIMAGGTGGHVFPALAVAQLLQEKGWQVSWLGTSKGLESRVVPENGIAIDWLAVAGVRGKGLWFKFSSVFRLLKACVQAASILRQRKPNVVLGMGGFVAGPGGLMAKILGIPLVIHEQNRVPGTTNRLLAKLAKQVLEAFPESFTQKAKAVCTGNPLRKQFLNLPAHQPRISGEPLKILIVGGSQGAQALNQVIPEALAQLADIQVKHQTGAVMQEEVAKHYKELNINAEALAFIENMVSAYQWADLVVCRAGAMTVSEVSAVGVPAIFIPLPNAIDDHQTANARFLVDAGAALMLPQKELTADNLAKQITKMTEQLETMGKIAKQCARLDATDAVAAVCMAEAKA